jgi:OOP family OmpA-OmpF porin
LGQINDKGEIMFKLLLGILVLSGFGITNASAGDSGVYAYVGAGQSQMQPNALPSSTSKNVETFKFQLGYQFNKNWAIEGAYNDLGKTDYSGSGTVGGVTGQVNLAANSKAASLTAVRFWNIQDGRNNAFSFLAKFGFAQVNTSDTADTAAVTLSNEYKKRGMTYGLGAKIDFDENWSLRFDADSLDTGNSAYGRVGVFSLGFGYRY